MAATNLYVSGLPEGLDEVTFRQLFEAYGTVVSTKYVPERRYGFVRYQTAEEAAAVQVAMNGFDYNGSAITVKPANDKTSGGAAPGASRFAPVAAGLPAGLTALWAGGGVAPGNFGAWTALAGAVGQGAPSDNLYIKGLPPLMTDEDLKTIFGAYGTVTQTRLLQTQATNNDPTGESIALVRMVDTEQAQWLVDNLNGNIPQGLQRPVAVRFADGGKGRAEKGAGRGSPYGAGALKRGLDIGGTEPEFQHAITETLAALGQKKNQLGADGSDQSCLYVKDLPPTASELYLYQVFAPLGAIESAHAMLTPQGACAGIGFVKFATAAEAALAIGAVNSVPLGDGSVLQVSIKKPKRQQAAYGSPTAATSIQPPPPPEMPSGFSGGEFSASDYMAYTQAATLL